MISAIEKLWPRISLLLLLALIISFVFFPGRVKWLPPTLFFASTTVAVAFLLRRPILAYQKGELERAAAFRRVALDLAGFLLPVGAAMLAGRAAGTAMNARWGPAPGLFSAFAGAFLAGLGTSLLWHKLALPRLPQSK